MMSLYLARSLSRKLNRKNVTFVRKYSTENFNEIDVPGEGKYQLKFYTTRNLVGSANLKTVGIEDQDTTALKQHGDAWAEKNKTAIDQLTKIYGEEIPAIPLTFHTSPNKSTLPEPDAQIGSEDIDEIIREFQGDVPYVSAKAFESGTALHDSIIESEMIRSETKARNPDAFEVRVFIPTPLDVSKHRSVIDEFNLTFWKDMYVDIYRSAIIQAYEDGAIEYENLEEGEFPYGPYSLRGSFGTPTHPLLVPSEEDKRIIACNGGAGPRLHETLWHVLKKEKPTVCLQCGQVFRLVDFDDWIRWAAREYIENKQDTVRFFLPEEE